MEISIKEHNSNKNTMGRSDVRLTQDKNWKDGRQANT
jgi:hypothetical protein